MMIEPLTSLAFSLFSGKGIYAVLLGSGVSRSAEIPTGWEMVLDLICKVAASLNEDCKPDPEHWFIKKFGTNPDYSNLLERLGITASERTNLLSSYFEASREDREQGRKVPTAAHKAIARLASRGFVRVIVTTNFDRLVEQALESEGVNPTVISTPDSALGALPLAHSLCTVIKLHGDYRDSRLRNTAEELSDYPVEMNRLLDQVFDEYGLIVCGWSATWDVALRNALLRCSSRRFTTYWSNKGTLSSQAQELAAFRQAVIFEIDSADALFVALDQKVEALEHYGDVHPLTTRLAVATLKRNLVDVHRRIDLEELVRGEVERQIAKLDGLPTPFTQTPGKTAEHLFERLEFYQKSLETLISIVANGCFYGTKEQSYLWRDVLVRLASISKLRNGGSSASIEMQLYPAIAALYAGGIAAVAAGRYGTLRTLFEASGPQGSLYREEGKKLLYTAIPGRVLKEGMFAEQSGQRRRTPASDYLREGLRSHFDQLIPGDDPFDAAFDRFEYLFTLAYADHKQKETGNFPLWAPVGRFTWRGRGWGQETNHISQVLAEECRLEGENWMPVREGLFKSAKEFEELNTAYIKNVLENIKAY